jgi:hypothetical protein
MVNTARSAFATGRAFPRRSGSVKQSRCAADDGNMRLRYVLACVAVVAVLVAGAISLVGHGGGTAAPQVETTTRPAEAKNSVGFCVEDTEGGDTWHYTSGGKYVPQGAPYRNDPVLEAGPCVGGTSVP